jgi:molybdopterin-guanine dinucleotide biosynthesis protein
MTEIVKKLRADGETVETLKAKGHWGSVTMLEQDAEITRLKAEVRVRQTIVEEARDERDAALAENERLRAALEKICNGPRDADLDYVDLFVEVKMEARAALTPSQEPRT